MKTQNTKHMSLVLSTIIVSSIGFIGCNGGSSSGSAEAVSRIVSGIVVDGYIKQSTVTLNSLTTQTSDAGLWSMAYTGNNSDVITVQGGIDTSTGKFFEGTLQAEIDADGANIVVTPLSTLVSSLVQNGATKAVASAKIATQLGISEATLAADPFALLATGTPEQKIEAAQAIKSILIVQKVAEAFAKSMGYSGSANYIATFAGVYAVIASQLNTADFDTVMADTAGMTTALQTALTITTDSLLNERLQAASGSVASIVTAIQSISTADIINNTNSVEKAVEQLTTLIENKLVLLSSAVDIPAIGIAQSYAETVAGQNDIASLVNAYISNPDLAITNSDQTPTPVTTETVAVTAANTSVYDANVSHVTFDFTAGTYVYAIANFNDGDILNFPEGNDPTIINTSFTDGNVTVQWANNGNVVTVNLSNIPISDDESLYGTTSFQTAFGTGSIQ
ncbi:MAG TPA: hypothetical protein CFH84_03445 [Sulfurimonas sp. UBA12504]|nr:MAG: hypothetical protein A2019_08490 [Sulfurimonas sp. GWF2_37_8]DAB30534.1 MAG TPA: hypothetical protein CFH84_03445 [Sulfurimonas sp. UBA12504]